MKIFIILSLLFFNEMCCENFSDSRLECNEIEQENRQLLLENGQLYKTIGDLRTEMSHLKAELYNMRGILGVNHREKRNTLPEEPDTIYMNCSALTDEAEYLSQNFKLLSEDVKTFNSYVDIQLGNYAKKTGKVEETVPKKFSGLKFSDLSLYGKVCDVKKSNGEWAVIQRRMDGSENFTRGWADYKAGFGTITGEFFIGLDNLHQMTTCTPQELLIEMVDFNNKILYAKYDLFQIGDESQKYVMKELGKYEGDVGDQLSPHKSFNFTTFDQDNDLNEDNCARLYKGGWWYHKCHHSNLNGEYGNKKYGEGINWHDREEIYYNLKNVEMKIRPKK